MKALIIEDEPFAQNELVRLLGKTDFDIEIIDIIESVEDAVEWFNSNPHPDLAFFDIQLADGVSFDIFTKVKINTPVIFTTAYDEYAIEAFKVNSIAYLMKPIELKALDNALLKLNYWQKQLTKDTPNLTQAQLHSIISLAQNKPSYKSRFMVKVGDQIKFIKADQVAYFFAEDNEVMLQTTEKKTYIIDDSLEQLSSIIDPILFHRINRKYIVNKNAVTRVHKYFNSRLKIDLHPVREEEVIISRVKVSDFLNWMEE